MKSVLQENKKKYLVKFFSLLISVTLAPIVHADFQYFGLLDVRFAKTQLDESWLDKSLSLFRIDERDEAYLGQFLIEAKWTWQDAHQLQGIVSAYDDVGDVVGINELFYAYRSSGTSGSRETSFEFKAGSFFPEISLENTGPGWTSRLPLSNSAINSWIGEELRVTGIQLAGRSQWQNLSLKSSVSTLSYNDTAGAMLAWRGWALHDRQVRLGEAIPMTNLPLVGGDRGFVEQTPWYEPFVEVDDELGYTFSLQLKHGKNFALQYYRYDNNADPTVITDGQYGWDTVFDHIGLSISLPGSSQLNSQWLAGKTLMGDQTSDLYIHNEFDAWYIALTKSFGKTFVQVRYDDFSVTDLDGTPWDNNTQKGESWAFALRYEWSNALAILAEYLEEDSERAARMYFLQPTQMQQRLSQVAIQWRF